MNKRSQGKKQPAKAQVSGLEKTSTKRAVTKRAGDGDPGATVTRDGTDELISTIGTEGQVVTLALDELLKRHYPVQRVTVLYTAGERSVIAGAVERVREETQHYAKSHPQLRFEFVPYCGMDGHRPSDVISDEDEKAVEATVYHRLLTAKQEGRRIHLSIVGGRTMLALIALPMAQLLFDKHDCCWCFTSTRQLVESKRMHCTVDGDSVELKKVRIIRWSDDVRAAMSLASSSDPARAVERQEEILRRDERQRKQHFLDYILTAMERTVLIELVKTAPQGASGEQMRQRLCMSSGTLNSHLGSIYRKFHSYSDYPNSIRVNNIMMVVEFQELVWHIEKQNEAVN